MKRKGHTRKKEDLNERRRKSFLTTILMEVIGCMIGGLMLAYMTAGGEWGFENGAFVFQALFTISVREPLFSGLASWQP